MSRGFFVGDTHTLNPNSSILYKSLNLSGSIGGNRRSACHFLELYFHRGVASDSLAAADLCEAIDHVPGLPGPCTWTTGHEHRIARVATKMFPCHRCLHIGVRFALVETGAEATKNGPIDLVYFDIYTFLCPENAAEALEAQLKHAKTRLQILRLLALHSAGRHPESSCTWGKGWHQPRLKRHRSFSATQLKVCNTMILWARFVCRRLQDLVFQALAVLCTHVFTKCLVRQHRLWGLLEKGEIDASRKHFLSQYVPVNLHAKLNGHGVFRPSSGTKLSFHCSDMSFFFSVLKFYAWNSGPFHFFMIWVYLSYLKIMLVLFAVHFPHHCALTRFAKTFAGFLYPLAKRHWCIITFFCYQDVATSWGQQKEQVTQQQSPWQRSNIQSTWRDSNPAATPQQKEEVTLSDVTANPIRT